MSTAPVSIRLLDLVEVFRYPSVRMNRIASSWRTRTAERSRPLALAMILFFVSIALYQPSTGFDFTIDDALVTTDNSHISEFAGNYLRFFTTSLYAGTNLETSNANLYRPVLKSSLAFNRVMSGEGFDPAAFHWFNVVLYAACVVVVFVFVALAFRSRTECGYGFAFLVALLFCVFPSHMESVCNINHRAEVLACLFGISAWALALWARGRRRRMLLSVVGVPCLFLLALGSKESAILLYPCMILFEFFWGESQSGTPRKPPAYLLAIPIAIFIYFPLRSNALGAFLSPEGTREFFPEDVGLLTRTLISSGTFVGYYLWDQLVSLHLDPSFSSRFVIMSGGRPALLDGVAFVFLSGVSFVAIWRLFSRRSTFAFWTVFVLVTSFLTMNVVPIGSAGAFRFVFTPSVGLCVLVALLVKRFVGVLCESFDVPAAYRSRAFGALMAVLIGFYAYVTHERMDIWQDDGRIHSYSASLEPMDPMSRYAAGQYYETIGLEAKKYAFYEASLENFLLFRDQPDLFDERSVDAFSVVATEIAYRELGNDLERAIVLADLAIEQFDRLAEMRAGRVDSNATAPYFVKAVALRNLDRHVESLAVCRAGLAIADHQGLLQLQHSLESYER